MKMSATSLLLIRATAAVVVSAITLGNILSFGLFTEDVAVSMGTTNLNAIAFIGEFQYICFLLSGIFIYPLHQGIARFAERTHPPTAQTAVTGWSRKIEDRYINVLGAALWMSGYGGSIALRTDYIGFLSILNFCGSIGAGLMYWNLWVMLPTWMQHHHASIPLVVLVIIIAPNLFVFLLSLCMWLILRMDNQLCADDSMWYCVYIWFFIAAGIALLCCAIGLTSEDPDEPKKKEDDRDVTPHPHPILWSVFVFILALFQATYYIPYLFVPIYVGSPPISGNDATVSELMTFLGLGSITGKIIGSLLLAFGIWILEETRDAVRMEFRVSMYMLWATVLLIMCSVWVACTGSLPGMKAFAFLFGVGAGGAMITQHMILFHGKSWVVLEAVDRVSIVSFLQGIGQIISAAIVRWGLPAQILDATSNLSPVYLSIATSTALWFTTAGLLGYLFVQIQCRK